MLTWADAVHSRAESAITEAATREVREFMAGNSGGWPQRVDDNAVEGDAGRPSFSSLARAALEGTALNLAEGLDGLRALGIAPREVRLTGGGAANVLWRQILADCFGLPIRVLEEPETAALGAAIEAAAPGVFSPAEKRRLAKHWLAHKFARGG